MFSGSTVTSDSKETELGSSDQEASPSAGKNMGLVLVPCLHMEVHPTTNFDGVDISQVPGCHLEVLLEGHNFFSTIGVS